MTSSSLSSTVWARSRIIAANGSTRWQAAPRRENQQYLELMHTPPFSHALEIAQPDRLEPGVGRGRPESVCRVPPAAAGQGPARRGGCGPRRSAHRPRQSARELEHCGTAAGRAGLPGRGAVHLDQVLRDFAPEQVFAQTLLGFETVAASMDAEGRPVGGHQLRAAGRRTSSPCATTRCR